MTPKRPPRQSERFDVSKIFRASGGPLVKDECVAANIVSFEIAKWCADAMRPCLRKSDARELGQHVYPVWRQTHLKDDAGIAEMGGGDVRQRRAKLVQRGDHAS